MTTLTGSAVALTGAIATGCASQGKIEYPEAPQEPGLTEVRSGVEFADPYRPLENDTAEATLEWVKAENRVTQDYLSRIPFRDAVRSRLTDLNNYRKEGLMSKHRDGKYYFYVNDGLQNQSVLYRSDSIGGEADIFLDPNTLSDDGTVALTGLTFSNDGRHAAYTISRNGSDWTEIYVMDMNTKELLPDHIEWAKFTDAAWDGDGFYYSAYPRPEAGKEFSNANENHQIYYHRLGTPQSDDRLVYEDPAHPLHFHTAYVPDNERYLFVVGGGEGVGASYMVKDLKKGGDWTVIEPSQDFDINLVDVKDDKFYFISRADAPKGRLMVADARNPQRANWKEIIPERDDAVLTGVQFAGDRLIVNYEKDASDRVYVYEPDGKLVTELQLPTFGSAAISSSKDNDEVYYAFSSFTYPSAIYSYDLKTGESTFLKEAEIKGLNLDDYVTEQVWYRSAAPDSAMIPMFITYKKGLEKNGSNPVYLYGYGGFNISLTPGFSPSRMLWLENGGIYAQASLRGGSEYGEEWHQAGTKMQKLNVFNDFIGAAEYLINEGWSSPEKMAIVGGSNGGLLVGATTNLRPDLFRVAIPEVGVMDMMRYHLFTIGWNWASDYGTSDDSEEMARYLLSYSPAHNVRNDGTPYPAILVTTADHDDRVVPAHSFKYAAALQAADTGDAPKLIRIDSNAGHGGGKPMSKVIDENADIYSFIFYNMGITPKK